MQTFFLQPARYVLEVVKKIRSRYDNFLFHQFSVLFFSIFEEFPRTHWIVKFLLFLSSELEEALIVLPFSVVTEMMTLLNHWLQVNTR